MPQKKFGKIRSSGLIHAVLICTLFCQTIHIESNIIINLIIKLSLKELGKIALYDIDMLSYGWFTCTELKSYYLSAVSQRKPICSNISKSSKIETFVTSTTILSKGDNLFEYMLKLTAEKVCNLKGMDNSQKPNLFVLK